MKIELKDPRWQIINQGVEPLQLFLPNRVYYNQNLSAVALVTNRTKEGGLVISAPAMHFVNQHLQDELAYEAWLVILEHGSEVVWAVENLRDFEKACLAGNDTVSMSREQATAL